MKPLVALFCGILIFAMVVAPASAETLKVYHIGNSLTDNIYMGGLKRIAERGKDTYVYGKHVSPGVPLDYSWQYKSITGSMYSVAPYGLYKTALKNYSWNVLTLEPFDNKLTGSTGDIQISKNFINYALPKSPNLQTYVYERWPRRPVDSKGKYLPFDYQKLWNAPYTGQTDRMNLANERRGYFEQLTKSINSALPNLKKKVKIVPVGDVLAELDKRIKKNQIDGIDNITDLYRDQLHFNNTGAYVIGLTFYATMFKQSPVGHSVPGAYAPMSTKLAAQIQDAVWDVVRVHPYAGVNMPPATSSLATLVPEPGCMMAILLLVPLGRRRARS
jgi:hypothetical protein